ncbi:hypothetical protein PVAND_014134 [Polypedilum vanderplanki]|uniref:Tyrosine aminotransferase n=1 Tax=Polypedilum vanderplanki TaxID=319348 RepID=A0A9J6CT77_POLVA|nr:hypothetical protein PVAND_014134 [Polypedilum vanderplanki]
MAASKIIKKWNILPTEFSKNSINPLRLLWETQQPKGNPKLKEIHLQPGDPTLYGNFPPHPIIAKAISDAALNDKFSYVECLGSRIARQAVADYSQHMGKITADDIILTTGCSMAVEVAIRSLANPDENVLVPRPSWNYSTWIHGSGILAKYYNLNPEKEWEIDLEDLQNKIDKKTKAIIVNSPGNPCGNVFSKNHILDIIEIAEKNCLPIISDEIYEFFTIPSVKFYSFATLSKTVPVLVCSGLTKRFLTPGIRLDWVIVNDRGDKLKEIRKGFQNIAGRNFYPNSTVQHALPKILSEVPQSFFDKNNQMIHNNAKIVYDRLKNVPGLNPIMSKGAIYMLIGIKLEKFPNINSSLEFMQRLANEQSVFTFPSEVFNFPGFLRFVLTSHDEALVEACERLSKFCEKYYKDKTYETL